MRVGVPAELKRHEYRVGLTSAAVREYRAVSHEVLVQKGAGAGIGASDGEYAGAGAVIASTAEEIFAKAAMIVKVKEPQPSEWSKMGEGQILFTYLHLAPDPKQAKGLLASGCTAVAYDTVSDERGALPLLAPISEVTGRLSIEAADSALKRYAGRRSPRRWCPRRETSSCRCAWCGVVGTHERVRPLDWVRKSRSLTLRAAVASA